MQEMTREDLIEEIASKAGVTAEEVETYLAAGDEYVENLPEDVQDIDGDDQLEYVYENTDLEPEVIEKIADAEFELLYE